MREIFIAWNGKTGNDFSLNVAGEMRGKHHTTPSGDFENGWIYFELFVRFDTLFHMRLRSKKGNFILLF